MREIYKDIDNLDNNKAPGPGYIKAWALKSGNNAIGTHLQIIFNDCIEEIISPTILMDAHITPIFKKGDVDSSIVERLEKDALLKIIRFPI